MRAVVVSELTGPDGAALAEVPEPEGGHWLTPDERLLIDVHAAAICFPDLLQTRGLYQHSVEPPFILRLPDHLSFAEGAALYMNYTTAWFGLHRAGTQSGETVLITGAAGGVGTAAIEVAKSFGARTIALVSSDEKEAAVRSLGADSVVRSTGPWLEEVRSLTNGRGVEVVLDMVGGDGFLDAVRALAIGGRLVVVGFAGGTIPTVKVNRLLLRNLSLTGISMDIHEQEHPGTMARVNAAVQTLADEGAIRPLIGARVPFEDGPEALRIMERREAIGKIVVDVRS